MFVNVVKCAVVVAIFLAVVSESQAQNGARYQMEVSNPTYGITSQWWPYGGGSYDYDGLLAASKSLAGSSWRFVSYRQVGQQATAPRGGKTLEQYKTEVQNAYRRAVDANNWARSNVGRLTEQQFNEVNQKINEFNSTLAAAQQGPYGSSFRSYQRLNTIPSSWVSVQYGIYYRRGNANWTLYQRVNGLTAAQNAVANLKRQYPSYQWKYDR